MTEEEEGREGGGEGEGEGEKAFKGWSCCKNIDT